jgi:predicted ribosome quality control (RQC) complex YloA/Tae2 family protein
MASNRNQAGRARNQGFKNQLYEGLSQAPNPQLSDSLINRIALAQSKIEVTHLKHFQDIKQLCSEEQLHEFNLLSKELADLFSRRPKH